MKDMPLLIFIASFILCSGITVVLFSVSPMSAALSFIIACGFALWSTWSAKKTDRKNTCHLPLATCHLFHIISLLLGVFAVIFLRQYQSSGTDPSPWQLLPPSFFWIAATVIFVMGTLLQVYKQKKIQTFLLLLFFLVFSLLALLFPLGSDYDPYIHRAAEQALVDHGSITPRTILYAGEYGIVAHLTLLTGLPVKTINIWLLPILAAVLLPILLLRAYSPFTALAFLLMPFAFLTTTVPQSLGMLFLLALILYHWKNTQLEIFFSILLTLTTLITHPFPGIAACIFLGWALLPKITLPLKIKNLKLIFYLFYFVISASLLPLALFANNFTTSEFHLNTFSFHPERFAILRDVFNIGWVVYQEPVSFAEFFSKNYLLFFVFVILFGLILNKRAKHTEQPFEQSSDLTLLSGKPTYVSPSQTPFLFSFFSILASALVILFFFEFNLTAVETRQIFERLLGIALLFLYPLFLDALQRIQKNYQLSIINYQISLFTLLVVTNIYINYPRIDRYENFKGFSVSAADLETVRAIELRAQKPYLVLANQQMGAAALDQFGFQQYVEIQNTETGRQFFYSIPISSRAQTLYLEILQNPERITEVFITYEIKELYVIVNPYWKHADTIAARLAEYADVQFDIAANRIFLFREK